MHISVKMLLYSKYLLSDHQFNRHATAVSDCFCQQLNQLSVCFLKQNRTLEPEKRKEKKKALKSTGILICCICLSWGGGGGVGGGREVGVVERELEGVFWGYIFLTFLSRQAHAMCHKEKRAAAVPNYPG